MAQNDFLVWAGGLNANVLTQGNYAGLGNLTSGVVSGKASGQQANKTWRQTSIMSAMLAKFIVDRVNQPVIDDGTIATIEANFINAILSLFVIPNTGVVPGTYGPTVSITVQADGRVTALSNRGLDATGVIAGTYNAPTLSIQADGRITSALQGPHISRHRTVYATHGSSSFIVPAGVYTVEYELWGAGSGGSFGLGIAGGPAAGSGGGYAQGALSVQPGDTLTVTIGQGSGAVSGGVTSAGGNSNIAVKGVITIIAFGAAGTTTNGQGPGLGGTATGGDVNMRGGAGGDVLDSTGSNSGSAVGGGSPRGGLGGSGGGYPGTWPGGGGGSDWVGATAGADGGCILSVDF